MQGTHNQENHGNPAPSIPTSRLERLLRERVLRRSSKSSQSLEEPRDSNGDLDTTGNSNDLLLSNGDRVNQDEGFSEGGVCDKSLNDGIEKQDVRVPKQRLLVVANRLPVSATRKGDDSWKLEISVGGLVSALLGKN